MNLYEKTATQLISLLQTKEVSNKEVVSAFIDRINSLDPKLNAFISTCPQEALEKAKNLDENPSPHPFAGIPIGIKDNINTIGQTTTCGSKMLENFISPYDATVVEKIKKQDLILMGKNNMDEFAIGTSGESSFFKPTLNPWNNSFSPGGSSSGSAVAVAAGLVPMALGTDTGGSIRVPAASCGVVGLKPTYGSVSRYGAVAVASSFDQIGPIGRSVSDVALLYDIIKGGDSKDAVTYPDKFPPIFNSLKGNLKGLKIGIPKEYFHKDADPQVLNAVEKALKEIEKEGATLVEFSLPSHKQALTSYFILSSAEISSNLARYDGVRFGYRGEEEGDWEKMIINTRSTGFTAEIQRRILVGCYTLTKENYQPYYERARSWREKIKQELVASFQQFDFIASPTAGIAALPSGMGKEDPVASYQIDNCTVGANLAGIPAITVPCGQDSNNIPIGLQLMGNHFSEAQLLDAAFGYERLIDGFSMPNIKGGSN